MTPPHPPDREPADGQGDPTEPRHGPGKLQRQAAELAEVQRHCAAAFIPILVLAAYLRLPQLGQPGLWLDEIFGVYGIGIEHGPLYYAVMRLGQQYSDATVRLPFAIAGLLTVLGIGILARKLFDSGTGILASLLLAVSPIHVYYSREARPYALLLLGWTIAGGLVFLLSSARRWYVAAIALAVTLCLLSLLSVLAVLYFASLFGLAFWLWRSGEMGPRRMLAMVLAITAGGATLAFLLYDVNLSREVGSLHLTAGGVVRLLQTLVSGTIESESVQPFAIVLAMVLLVAAFTAPNGRSSVRWALLASTLAGIGATFVVFWAADGWMTARYLLCSLIPLTILLALGIRHVLEVMVLRVSALRVSGHRIRTAVLLALIVIVVAGAVRVQWLAIVRGAQLKADWRRVAKIIDERAEDSDVVIASNPWNALCLRYHLPRVGSRVQLLEANESLVIASNMASQAGKAFLVSGPYDGSIDVPAWMARFRSVYESPVEMIRVTMYPVARADVDR